MHVHYLYEQHHLTTRSWPVCFGREQGSHAQHRSNFGCQATAPGNGYDKRGRDINEPGHTLPARNGRDTASDCSDGDDAVCLCRRDSDDSGWSCSRQKRSQRSRSAPTPPSAIGEWCHIGGGTYPYWGGESLLQCLHSKGCCLKRVCGGWGPFSDGSGN